MTEWNANTEKLIRDVSDFVYRMTANVLDPNVGTPSTIKHVFNERAAAKTLYERATSELGIDLKGDWQGSIKKVIDLAESNGSDAADKLKKVLPVAKQLADEFGFGPDTEMGYLKQVMTLNKIKKKNIKLG